MGRFPFLTAVILSISAISQSRTASSQMGAVTWEDIKTGTGVYRLPRVTATVDLNKYPNRLKDLNEAKGAKIEYLTKLTQAYSRAYAEDRKIPEELTPFDAALRMMVRSTNAKRKHEFGEFTRMTPEEFRGEVENPVITERLDLVAIFFEESGELENVRHWRNQFQQINGEIKSISGKIGDLESGVAIPIGKKADSLMEEIRNSISEAGILNSRLRLARFLGWIAIGFCALFGVVSIINLTTAARD